MFHYFVNDRIFIQWICLQNQIARSLNITFLDYIYVAFIQYFYNVAFNNNVPALISIIYFHRWQFLFVKNDLTIFQNNLFVSILFLVISWENIFLHFLRRETHSFDLHCKHQLILLIYIFPKSFFQTTYCLYISFQVLYW